MERFFDELYKKEGQVSKCCENQDFILLIVNIIPFDYGYLDEVAMGYCGSLGYTAYIVHNPEPRNGLLVNEDMTESQYSIKCRSCERQWMVKITHKDEINKSGVLIEYIIL